MAAERKSFTASTKQKVTRDMSTGPLVGFENTKDLPDGWQYDVKRWSSPFDLKLPHLPKLEDASMQGIPESYFLPGVSDANSEDLFLRRIEKISGNKPNQWVPVLATGDYFRHDTSYYLFSDHSVIDYAIESDDELYNYAVLSKEPRVDTEILVASFERDKERGIISYNKKLTKVERFTGDGETLSPAREIIWDNVDRNKREFLLSYPNENVYKIVLNNNYFENHGVELDPLTDPYAELEACEYLGEFNGIEYTRYPLRYFPVFDDLNNDTFHLYIADEEDGTYEEWERVDEWWKLTDDMSIVLDKKYFLDRDLGFVCFGNTFSGFPAEGSKIYASYQSTVRIEYEEESEIDLDIRAVSADVNPVTQATSQGFVCVTSKTYEVAALSLSIDKNKISGAVPTQYGPVYAGTDYSILTATATTILGEAVPNTEVDFSITPTTIGTVGGFSAETTSTTNSFGKALTPYQAPTTSDSLGWFSKTVRDSVDYPGRKEIIVKEVDSGLQDKEKIFLYLVLKDDPLLGYDTLDGYLDTIYANDPPAWIENLSEPDKTTAKNQWKVEMISLYDLKDWENVAEGEVPAGRKVVVYRIDYDNNIDNSDPNAINPVTGEDGAVMPVFPEVVEQITDESDDCYGFWRLVYPAAAIPEMAGDIGGYWVVGDRIVKAQASCWSAYHNQIIYSNIINIKVSPPDYMLGVYINDQLKSIPFGWKIKDENIISSVLNTTTFITINPYSGPYEIIDLVNDEATGTWASAPFRTVNFIFEIEE